MALSITPGASDRRHPGVRHRHAPAGAGLGAAARHAAPTPPTDATMTLTIRAPTAAPPWRPRCWSSIRQRAAALPVTLINADGSAAEPRAACC